MPVRATKRGAARVPFATGADADVLVCGASFAGLTVARELRATGARVLVLDRYEIGERQTSACAAPTEWLRNLGLEASIRQTFGSLLVHTPRVASARWALPFTFSTFDYRQLCGLLWEQSGGAEFETAKVDARAGSAVRTDRGAVRAPLVVDALGWRRVLGTGVQPPEAALSRRLEGHPGGAGGELGAGVRSRRARRGPGAVDRPALRGRRLRLVVPGARRAANRRRVLRPARPGQAADAAARGGRGPAAPGRPGPPGPP